MNDQVFGVQCSNGYCEFDSHTTTKINIKYEKFNNISNNHFNFNELWNYEI